MQSYKNGVRVSHFESISVPLKANDELLDRLIGEEDDDILSSHWFEQLNREIRALMQELPDGKLKDQLAVLKAVAAYGYNSAVTEGLDQMYFMNNYLTFQFAFSTHTDASEFLAGLWDLLETL